MDSNELLNQFHKLENAQRATAEKYERERRDNIKKRYSLLVEALETAKEPMRPYILRYIAGLGEEFEYGKAVNSIGGEPW